MSQLCEIFKALSVLAFEWAERQDSVKEETLTDWLLDRASFSPFVFYHSFTRRQEAFWGADWDWYIVSSGRWLSMRIQAKRLHARKNHRPSLAYKNSHGLQIDHLLNSSRHHRLVPLYCFYNAEPNLITRCKSPQATHRQEGILLASGVQMKNLLLNHGIYTCDISNSSIPLPCIFCCPLPQETDPIDRVHGNLSQYFYFGDYQEMLRIHDGLPEIVVSLLHGEHNEMGAKAWEEKYLEDAPPKTSAIVVTDITQER